MFDVVSLTKRNT